MCLWFVFLLITRVAPWLRLSHGIQLTVKRVERSAEAAGAAAAALISAEADAICSRQVIPAPPPEPVPDMLYIAIDGTGVPMVPAATRGRRQGDKRPGPHPRDQDGLPVHPDHPR